MRAAQLFREGALRRHRAGASEGGAAARHALQARRDARRRRRLLLSGKAGRLRRLPCERFAVHGRPGGWLLLLSSLGLSATCVAVPRLKPQWKQCCAAAQFCVSQREHTVSDPKYRWSWTAIFSWSFGK